MQRLLRLALLLSPLLAACSTDAAGPGDDNETPAIVGTYTLAQVDGNDLPWTYDSTWASCIFVPVDDTYHHRTDAFGSGSMTIRADGTLRIAFSFVETCAGQTENVAYEFEARYFVRSYGTAIDGDAEWFDGAELRQTEAGLVVDWDIWHDFTFARD